MRIVNAQSALLSNHEVYQHIRSESEHYLHNPDKNVNRDKALSNVREILQDGLRYFDPDSSTQFVNPAKETSDLHPSRPLTLYKGPHSLLRALAPHYRLNKAEYLQIYNVRPTSRITLELIIEEATLRFSEEQLDAMLDAIWKVFYEEEKDIPAGVEHVEMDKLPDEMLGDSRRKHKRKVGRRKV